MPYKDPEKRKEANKRNCRRYYERHKESCLARAKQQRERQRPETRKWLLELKAEKGCSRCDEKDPCCLDFHHRDPTTKLFEISKAVRLMAGKKTLLAEIAKCDLMCANCHRKHHYGRRYGRS